MIKIIIESVYAVGMHHYGGRSLEVGSGYKVIPEPNNKYDTNLGWRQPKIFSSQNFVVQNGIESMDRSLWAVVWLPPIYTA